MTRRDLFGVIASGMLARHVPKPEITSGFLHVNAYSHLFQATIKVVDSSGKIVAWVGDDGAWFPMKIGEKTT
jgi:hypothetical protein